MKIAILSDVHHGSSGYFKGVRRKLTEFSEQYISDFVQLVSNEKAFEFAVHLGDIIQDSDSDTDLITLREALSLFRRCTKPLYHLIGNHDVKYLSVPQVLSELDYPSPFYSFDRSGYHFVFLFTEVNQELETSLVNETQFNWLANDLSGTVLPTVIFCHHSLADQDLIGNPWFEGRPQACLVGNRQDVRDLILSHGNIRCVLNGHLHWNHIDIHSKIPFFTIQSSTENFNNDGIPANAWAILELTDNMTSIQVNGNDKMSFNMSVQRTR